MRLRLHGQGVSTMTSEPRMTPTELFAEIDWLLDSNVHPRLIAQELHRTPAAIERMARKHGRNDLSTIYGKYGARRDA
jgi:hypothetical protein